LRTVALHHPSAYDTPGAMVWGAFCRGCPTVTLYRWQWGRCTRPEVAVLLVDRGSQSAEWLPCRLHGHHVPRDVEADVSGRTVIGEGDASV
jgi:hypothetical protein